MTDKDDKKRKPHLSKNDEKLQKEVDVLKERLDETEECWKRALADYRNLQRRTTEGIEKTIRFANYELISELIEVYDNMEIMSKHTEDKGLKMITEQFWEKLSHHGLEKIKASGKDFDENIMEAVETKEGPEGKVLDVTQKGYKFKDRLVRPAKVIVGVQSEKRTESEKHTKNKEE